MRFDPNEVSIAFVFVSITGALSILSILGMLLHHIWQERKEERKKHRHQH